MLKVLNIFLLIVSISILTYAESSRLDNIIKNNKIKVCIWPEYYGISYLDSRTQKLIGIDSDLAKELAYDLNVKLEYVPSSFATLIGDITTNKCDIAMFAIGNTKLRREKIRFTTPHLFSDIYAITTRTNKKINSWDDIDKKGIIVAVAKGTYHEPVMRRKLKNAKLLVVNSYRARQQEVQSGRADLFMTDYPFGKRMIEKTQWAKLITPNKQYYITPYAWALNYGDEKFFKKIEKFVMDIKQDGRLLKLAKNNGLLSIVKAE